MKNTPKSIIKEYKVSEDVYIAVLDNTTPSTETILKGIDKRYIQFYFCTKGSLTFNFNNGIYKINLVENRSFLFYYPSLDLPLSLNIHADSKVFIVVLSLEKLFHLFTEYGIQDDFISNINLNKFYQEKIFTPQIALLLSQIEENKLAPQFEKLYLIAKMYELFTLYFSNPTLEETEQNPFISNTIQAKKLKQIKNMLMENLTNPPTIKEICNDYSISEYLLKDGFKKIYNNTVYGFILEKKLEIAKNKLEEGSLKVKDIAFEIGYENPSHFISAFKKKYGITPKQFTKTLE
ncbi:helix-turn-helix transcriptional regulator [Faecalibacter rhinopitheci]|uniref:Helix-turn-helix transcriptional regulator n=1 Tax=Faecalibacter rhinopitheci TaxID=2779678 RepID=A0A8J7FRZ7_9FLAO|nr:AraC family transcriptional regulator [Faecalibacter rhinopitheci]MBF0596472.1 helix-turn-helix transcriptional regulator [Faecalibacter rhinopitheci]